MKALRHAPWLLLFALTSLPHARAQTACPFFTQGTAATYLQAPVELSTDLNANNEGSCTFTAHDASSTITLKLTATTAMQPACPSGKPLTGIGTEATLCTRQTADTISARLRDLYLTIQLTTTGKPTKPFTTEQRQTIVQNAAEILAGNLF
ncbi:MAG: hypothetical protein WBY53_17365 [Acidobacteriaceae bacterium]